MNMDKKLAEALRACETQLREYVAFHDAREGCSMEIAAAWEGARDALKEYDAQQPAAPAPGAHTAEPWESLPTPNRYWRSIVPQGGKENDFDEVCKAKPNDARRIVACVNACAGIADPSRLVPALQKFDSLIRQRASMLGGLSDEMQAVADNARTALERNA